MGLGTVGPMMRGILRSRKGIFFTLIAVSLLTLVLFTYSVTYSYSLQEQTSIIETRVQSMNRFLREVDSDMENAIYIAAFRALISMEDEIATSGVFVNDTQDAFEELFLYGTLGGETAMLMENNTFPYWVVKINEQANAVGIALSVVVSDVEIYHTSPWNVRAAVNATVNISDSKSTAGWVREKDLFADIDIIGFEDPWYTVYTNNNIVKRINITVYDGNFTGAGSNTTNIRDHVEETMYANFTGAPSFLMRFEDDFGPSAYGIESFVDKGEVGVYHACPTETSSVDSIYWQCNSSIGVFQVADWSGFRIDNETDASGNLTRLERYMMEDYIIG
jgi:hypothetical protein